MPGSEQSEHGDDELHSTNPAKHAGGSKMIAGAVALSLVTALVLIGIYAAMRSHWPSSYIDVTTTAGQIGRFSFSWFIAFRTAPAFVVATVVATTAERSGMSAWIPFVGGFALFIAYGLRHNIRERRRRRNRINVLIVGIVGALLSVAAGALGTLVRRQTSPLVPEPQALLEAIWTAMIVAGLYFAVHRILGDHADDAAIHRRAKSDLGKHAWRYSAKAAAEHGVPAAAVRAILLAEAIQRPRWFRVLERLIQHVGRRFGREGTTGVAQMRSSEVLSDEESVRRLCLEMAKYGLRAVGISRDELLERLVSFARCIMTMRCLLTVSSSSLHTSKSEVPRRAVTQRQHDG